MRKGRKPTKRGKYWLIYFLKNMPTQTEVKKSNEVKDNNVGKPW